jgi:regulator of chromosome condensation
MSPQKIPKLEGLQITQVACGEAHSIVMTKEGRLYGWGMSNYGQLGLGYSADSFEPGVGMEKSKVYDPTEIMGLKGEGRVMKIICGATFSLFQTEKGDIYGCGLNDLG